MPKIGAIVECRMNSTRLPGKVLLEVNGKPFLQILVERLRQVKELDEIILATTTNPADDKIVELAKKIEVKYYRGSEEDVLSRVLGAAKENKIDVIVEVTGDCPLIDPKIVSQTVKLFLESNVNYSANDLEPSYPLGMDVQVFKKEALEIADKKGKTAKDREHVSLYIVNHPQEFKQINLRAPESLFWPDLRLTLDERDDYIFLKKIQEYFESQGIVYPSCKQIIFYLKNNPELIGINKNVKQKAI